MWRLSLIVAFIEIAFLFLVGLYLSANEQYAGLSSIWVVVGAVLVIHRLFLIFELKSETKSIRDTIEKSVGSLKEPLKKIADVIDISSKSDVASINTLLRLFLSLREEKLAPERQRIVETAVHSMKSLNTSMKTPVLEEPDFYRWLKREFDNAPPGAKIQIVSMDEPLEWNDSYQEQEYFKRNVGAAQRGAKVERIFVFSAERLPEAGKNKFIRAHAEGNDTGLIGRKVDRESFQRSAPVAYKDAGQGFILVDGKFTIVDVFSDDGQARGYVTFNESEVEKYRETFERFHSLSAPLVFES